MPDFSNNALAVTAASQRVDVGTDASPQASVRVINDGANNLTFRVWRTGDTVLPAVDAANGGFLLEPGDNAEIPANIQWGRRGIVAITIIAPAGLATTARVWAPGW